MPKLSWNRRRWNDARSWPEDGEEWSYVWGSSHAQWMGSIWPRINRFLPARSVLEIAPGLGRWTRFLLPACEQYMGVDLSGMCVERCRERFEGVAHATFVKNDGRSLAKVPDGSVDFAFSFDSLVHVDVGVLRAYLEQLVRKLTPTGAAFIHHSNALGGDATEAAKHARALDVSAAAARETIERSGGRVLIQEEINWGAGGITDAFTLFSRAAAFPGREPVLLKNLSFMHEAHLVRVNQSPYSAIEVPLPD